MRKPVVKPGIKKANNFAALRINRCGCRGLIGIAVPAGKRQILTYRKPPLRLGHDVFNFKIDGTKWFLPPAAVLAAAIRPAFNQRT